MKKTFKYRLKANKNTPAKTEEILSLCRILYNFCLEQRNNAWKFHQKSLSSYNQIKQLPELKKAFSEFNKVPSQTLQEVVERVDKAFQGFFRRVKAGEKLGYPRFKSYNRYDSFTLKQAGWKLHRNILTIPKIGIFKIILHRPIQGDIKTITIRKNPANKWYVCFSCEEVPIRPFPKSGQALGIDMGCQSFLTDSNGRKIDNPHFFKKSQDLLKARQQKLAQKKMGSQRRNKARILVAKIHEKIFNQRRDFHFKVANRLLKQNDHIYIEKLSSWNNWRNLNRSMRDAAWFGFFDILRFKAEEAGKEVVEVPAKNTSQVCSSCRGIVPKDLSCRIHRCSCGLVIDRDVNSTINILRLGASLQDSVSLS